MAIGPKMSCVVLLWDMVSLPFSLALLCSRVGFIANARLIIVYYFFNDIYPANHNGQRPLDPPIWWQRLIRGNTVVDAELRQQRPAETAAPAVQLQ